MTPHAPRFRRPAAAAAFAGPLAALLTLLMCIGAAAAAAAAAPASLRPGEALSGLAGLAETLEHARGAVDLDSARQARAEGRFAPPSGEAPRAGMTLSAFWLAVDLRNDGGREGAWRLDAGRPFLRRLDVRLERDGRLIPLLSESRDRPFHERPGRERMLRSAPLTLGPGEEATLWIGYATDGPAGLDLSLQPQEAEVARQVADALGLAAFYAAGGLLLALLLGFFAALRRPAIGWYAVFFAGLLAYNAQLEGLMFQLVWPFAPRWNAAASHVIGMLALAAGLMFSRALSDAPRARPWLNRALLTAAAGCLLFTPAPLAAPLPSVKTWGGLFVLGFLALQIWTAVAVLRDGRPGARFFALGVTALLGYLGFYTVTSQVANLAPDDLRAAVLRVGQIVDGAVFAAAALTQAAALRRREAEASALAERRRAELASLRHDLRQPLLSLRLAAESLQGAASADARERLARSSAYLEALLEAEPEAETAPAGLRTTGAGREVFAASAALDAAAYMFVDEAKASGARLRAVPCSAPCRPLPWR